MDLVSRKCLNNLNIETTPTKHQNGDRFYGSSNPKEAFSDAPPGKNETQSNRSDSLGFGCGSPSPLQDSSQKENESPPKEKTRRLLQAIEKGCQIRYLFNRTRGEYDVYASMIPGDDGRGSDNEVEHTPLVGPPILTQHMLTPRQGSSRKENESPSHEMVSRLSQAIEMGHQIRHSFNRASGKYAVCSSTTPGGDERRSEDEIEHSLLVGPPIPKQHMLTPLQGSSQKENESPSHETVSRLSQTIEMSRDRCSQSNDDDSGECDLVVPCTSDGGGKGPNGEAEKCLPTETTNSGPHTQSFSRNSSQKEKVGPDDKSGRVSETTDGGYQVEFRSGEGMRGQDTFVHASDHSGTDLDDNVRHGFSEAPTLSGQVAHSRSPSHGISNAIRSGLSHLRKVSQSEQKSVRPGNQDTCQDPITLPQPKLDVDQECPSDEDEICRQNGPPKGAAEENRGDLLAVMVRGKTMFRKISPIPFDIHIAPPVRTPSVSSDATKLEDRSSARSYLFCKGAVKECDQEFVLTTVEESEIRKTNLSEGHPPDIEIWIDETESSTSDTHHEIPGVLGVLQDIEYAGLCLLGEQEEPTPGLGTLRDLNNSKPSSSREQDETADSFDPWGKIELDNHSPSEGEKRTPRLSENREDDKLGDLTLDGNHKKAPGSFSIWEENESSNLIPDKNHTETAGPLDVWEDNKLSNLTPHGNLVETAGSFEIWEDHELDSCSPISKPRENAVSFEVWNDAEYGYFAMSQPITALPYGALNNVTNIPRRQCLPIVDSARASAVGWEMENCIDANRISSLREARRLPHSGGFQLKNEAESPDVGEADDSIDAIHPAHALSALHEYYIGHPPCPPNSLSSSVVSSNSISRENENRAPVLQQRYPLVEVGYDSPSSSPLARAGVNGATAMEEQPRQKQGSASAESLAFAPEQLARPMSAQPFSPTQRLAHPTPRRWINPEALFERFQRAAGTNFFDRESGFRNLKLNTRPQSRIQPGNTAKQSRYVLRELR